MTRADGERFCKDCRHVRFGGMEKCALGARDPVNGQYELCIGMRGIIGKCGPEGRRFEPRQTWREWLLLAVNPW